MSLLIGTTSLLTLPSFNDNNGNKIDNDNEDDGHNKITVVEMK